MLSTKVNIFVQGLIALLVLCTCEKRLQLVLEHPNVTYVNPRYIENLTLTCRRYSRRDPRHYLSIYAKTKKPFDNNYSIYFNFYELLSNVYKPSFVTLHFDNYCDMVEKDTFIGTSIKSAYIRSTPVEKRIKDIKCPIPSGEYMFENITIPYTPLFKRFPFANGRIFVNVTYNKDTVTSLFLDMAIK